MCRAGSTRGCTNHQSTVPTYFGLSLVRWENEDRPFVRSRYLRPGHTNRAYRRLKRRSALPADRYVLTFVSQKIRPDYTQITTIFFTERYALSRCYAQRVYICIHTYVATYTYIYIYIYIYICINMYVNRDVIRMLYIHTSANADRRHIP